jgi:hypothetical protein
MNELFEVSGEGVTFVFEDIIFVFGDQLSLLEGAVPGVGGCVCDYFTPKLV